MDIVVPQVDNGQVKYIGPVNTRQKTKLLSRARGFLNPIEWEEPFGMVMIEAMTLACPVISFARGAAPEIIVHEKTGFLVQNVDEMVRCISRIGEADRIATRGHVEQHFSARVMVENYVKVFNKVIMKRKGSPTAGSLVRRAPRKARFLRHRRGMPERVDEFVARNQTSMLEGKLCIETSLTANPYSLQSYLYSSIDRKKYVSDAS